MYNFQLENNEDVVYVNNNVYVKEIDNDIEVSLVLTNKRLLLFKDVNKELEYKELFRITKGVSYSPNNELFFEINIDSIIDIQPIDFYDKYIFKDGNYILISSEELFKIMTKK
jgi:hypothetical protein